MKTNENDHHSVERNFCAELEKFARKQNQMHNLDSNNSQDSKRGKIPPRKLIKLPPHEHLLFSGLRTD